MTEPALFAVVGPDGPAVDAMTAQIAAWQRAGRAVSIVTRRTLIDQAHAIDLARAARRPTAITGASKTMLDLLVGFRLIDDAPPPADAAFDSMMAAILGNDDDGTG